MTGQNPITRLMDKKTVIEGVGAFGVIVSLVFVGLEIRQNTQITRAATQQAVYDAVHEFADNTMANDRLIDAIL